MASAVSYTFDGTEADGHYRWLAHAQVLGGGGVDSVFGIGFYYDQGSNTALASAEQEVVALPSLPKSFSLAQNHPNPFNPSTTINYEIPPGEAPDVTLKVYNVRGKLIKTLVSAKVLQPGSYSAYWDGRDAKGRPMASGVYFYRLEAGEFIATRKMVILK